MTIRHLPALPEASTRLRAARCDLTPQALERWDRSITAAATGEANTISILEPIGSDPWTGEGVTAKRIAGALRGMSGPVTVAINSPGGNYFEGLAIYNLLRGYKGAVNVQVIGVAASAASVIAMAGDRIEIAKAGFLMIHNSAAVAAGGAEDFRSLADTLDQFDAAMAEVYAQRTGQPVTAIQALLDAETWISGQKAVDDGYADALLPADQVRKDARAAERHQIAAQRLDVILAQAGLSRSERRALLNEFKSGMPGAAGHDDTPSAVDSGTPRAAEPPAPTGKQLADVQAALLALTLGIPLSVTGEPA